MEIYWREQYRNEPYYDSRFKFSDYLPAYILGSENYDPESCFDAAENGLALQWANSKGPSRLAWEQARDATRAGWYHLQRKKIADSPSQRIGLPGCFTRRRRLEYEQIFGTYHDDKYIKAAECPEDRREMVAEIKVSSAAMTLAGYLMNYASGFYPARDSEKHKLLFEVILEWDPHLPR
ncbi:MAG: hypothetical protein ABIT37_15725 [Luteolibacter sp.]